ncbi:MAG TPA: N-acetylmuramoyl-L-alanine amidase [Candidatus Edwardsbacteria bacterium]|nr:N-acetylmuramoyl-L-alanine amidase [Candidatus Edwardsbacteria bacterium]
MKKYLAYILFILAASAATLSAADQQLTLIDGTGHGRILQTLLFDKEEYLPLTEVVDAWGAQAHWSELEGNADISFPGHSLRFSSDNTFFVCDGKVFNLYNPVRLYNGELWVPLELFRRFLVPQWGASIIWDEPSRKLSLGGVQPDQVQTPVVRPHSRNGEARAIRKVVIDPGHGGKDPGALGTKGTQEKDINLDIGLKLKTILEDDYGLIVVMTRSDDTFIPLKDRTALANKEAADLFISVHCNSAPRKKRLLKTMRGFETYFLSVAKTDDARATAAMENSAVEFEQPQKKVGDQDEVQFILWDMIQNEYLIESSDLAELIEQSLAGKIAIPARGISQAGFYVLNGAYMPAVLVETAFVSHKDDEKLLKTDAFREKIALGIANGIAAFARKYKRQLGAAQ